MEGEPSVQNTPRSHFINQACSSPSHTKLTCRCSGHIQAREINHSGREQGSRQRHPSALLTRLEMCACEGGSERVRQGGCSRAQPRPTCTSARLQREAAVCDVINDLFSSYSLISSDQLLAVKSVQQETLIGGPFFLEPCFHIHLLFILRSFRLV